MIGRTNARVLPDPVLARPTTSLPLETILNVDACSVHRATCDAESATQKSHATQIDGTTQWQGCHHVVRCG